MANKRKRAGPSIAMAEVEAEDNVFDEEEPEIPVTKPPVEFDFNKYKVANKTEVKTLSIEDAEFNVTVKPLSWSRRNQILSKAMAWDADGGTKFDGDVYVRECLKEMIIDAPWGKTSELFLISIDERLGSVLEQLVPQAFGTDALEDVDTLKDG